MLASGAVSSPMGISAAIAATSIATIGLVTLFTVSLLALAAAAVKGGSGSDDDGGPHGGTPALIPLPIRTRRRR